VAIGGAGLIPLVDGRAPLYTPLVPSAAGRGSDYPPGTRLFHEQVLDTLMSGRAITSRLPPCVDRPQAGEKYSIGREH